VIGIVLVSHSHETAEGAAELARQMGGTGVSIATAGGLDGPDHPVGTDAMRVLAAIEQVWSDDGVLVLMDLGSAVLSAEMAIDFLDVERRPKVLLSGAPFVEGAVAAAVAAKLGQPLSDVELEARGGLAGKETHLGIEIAPSVPEAAQAEGPEDRASLLVDLPHGLHARPAARVVQTAGAFDAEITVSNATTGRGPVNARSLNAVATLGVTEGQSIEVVARGPGSTDAVAALRALAARRYDEIEEEDVPSEPSIRPGSAGHGVFVGRAASPGIAIGPARRMQVPELPTPEGTAVGSSSDERALLDAAIRAAADTIASQRDATAARLGPPRSAIFDAHLLFLSDEALRTPAEAGIDAGRSAAVAWSESVAAMAESWEALDDPYLRARADDLRSVGRQVLARLLGVDLPQPGLPAPGVLLATDLEPADTVALDPEICFGIATTRGGPTSHAAVLARAMGIPAVVGLEGELASIADGTLVGVDGDGGLLYVDPSSEVRETLEAARLERELARRRALASSAEPATTRDGLTIEVAANIGGVDDAVRAVRAGCDGVGLLRTEFLFLGRDAMPDEGDQEASYRSVAEALEGRPMVVRTLDAGADKPLPYLEQPAELNPFLGVRGLRLGLARPEVLDVQLRALLRVAAEHPLRIMLPMVATLDELRAGRAALDRARQATGIQAEVQLGIMIEVPAAALTAPHLAQEADFFSIGTNDLTQYTLAADRGNERVAALADPLHPAVLRLIASAAEAASARGAWTGVCGELAGEPRAAALLLGLGVRELSMSPPAIPLVKEAIREITLASAETLAARALGCATADEVRSLLP
jgi:phosphoenolpyruvate-protein phosphotransferase/dihydroxyacetone kinase phosphotransfer subunit